MYLEDRLIEWASDLQLNDKFYEGDRLHAIRFENIKGATVIVRGYTSDKPEDYFPLTLEEGYDYNEFWLEFPDIELNESNIFSVIKSLVFEKITTILEDLDFTNLEVAVEMLSRSEKELIDPLMVLARQIGFWQDYDNYLENCFLELVNHSLPPAIEQFKSYLDLTDFIFVNQSQDNLIYLSQNGIFLEALEKYNYQYELN